MAYDYSAAIAEGGYKLTDHLWLHALVADGKLGGGNDTRYLEVQAGIEASTCDGPSVACVIAGVDAGFDSQIYTSDHYMTDAAGAVLVPRAGLDVGTQHVRFRPTLRVIVDPFTPVSGGELAGLELSATVAYRW